MRRALFLGLGLCFFLVSLGASAVGEVAPASAQTTPAHISFVGSPGCNLVFAFRGFEAGAMAKVDVFHEGALVHTFVFDVPMPSP